MQPNPFLGVVLHSIGAFSSSSCYTPQKQTKLWSWEIYWIMTAFFAWLILPIAGAFLTIPNYLDVVAVVPARRHAAFSWLGDHLRCGRADVRPGDPIHRFLAELRDRHRHFRGTGDPVSVDLASQQRFRVGDLRQVLDLCPDRSYWPGFSSR